MSSDEFIDYYDLLQLSQNADTDTIERIFRHFARKYHPDNTETGDSDRFRLIVDAHKILSDPEKRAGYDVRYQDYWNRKWNLAFEADRQNPSHEAGSTTDFGDDGKNRQNLMSILYAQRRQNMKRPGVGDYELARLLGLPLELIEFHIWYLKAKGWVEQLDTGQIAISASGVDEVERNRRSGTRNDPALPAGVFAGQDGAGSAAAHSNQQLFDAFLSSTSNR
ncbi:MAG TPA: molecular chaperone DnaJ [Deltaproteobacteria bacterium]|nr:molecular chaperone DnaJ [Deltaproteobacteria bacterium]